MPSHFTIVPASTSSGRETIRTLLASDSKPFVRGVYRDISKAPAEFTQNSNFEAVKGDVSTGEGLDFSDSDAVLYVPPPTYDGTDTAEHATRAALHIQKAIQIAPKVKRLVLHSALGAQFDHGIGVLKLNNITDRLLESAAPEVLIVRPGWFYEMWAHALKTMQEEKPSFESHFSPADHAIPMVSVRDVGAFCAQALLASDSQRGVRTTTLFTRRYSSLDVKKAIEEVTGKEGRLAIIEKDQLEAAFAKEVPEFYAKEFAEMIISLLPGGIMTENMGDLEDSARGQLELVDVLREIASK